MKGSLIIVGFFTLGIILGLLNVIPVDIAQTDISLYTLYALMFCVGFSMGNDPDTFKKFKKLNPGVMLLPVMTILGTLSASALVGLLMPQHTVTEWMAVGAGMGYYSLSSVLITEIKGVELGTIALLSNIIREIITLLGAPLLVRVFGTLAPISSGGATTMDTTLPIIVKTSGKEYTIVSIFHGMCADFSVPFIVTFFASIG